MNINNLDFIIIFIYFKIRINKYLLIKFYIEFRFRLKTRNLIIVIKVQSN